MAVETKILAGIEIIKFVIGLLIVGAIMLFAYWLFASRGAIVAYIQNFVKSMIPQIPSPVPGGGGLPPGMPPGMPSVPYVPSVPSFPSWP